MLLQVILSVLCILQLAHYVLKAHKLKSNEDDSKPTRRLSFIQSVPVYLEFLFNNKIPNYELSTKWSEIFGRIAILAHPFKTWVFVNITDLAVAKRIMSSAAWSNRFRSDHYIYNWSFRKPLGLLFANGGYWKESRKLTMKLFHQLDFYRQENVENFINFELKDLGDEIERAVKDKDGKATMTMNHKFEVSALNVVFQVMMGKRFERDDPVAKEMMTRINAGNRVLNFGTSILEMFPWLLRVPFLKLWNEFTPMSDGVCEYVKRELLEPKLKAKSYAENPVDFVDYFLLEIDRRAHETPSYLTYENLVVTLRDLVFAGTDTTNTALEHGILHVSLNPLIQKKVQDEIDRIVGSRQPLYDDRLNMHYTQAVLQEILRISTPAPMTARCPLHDNEIYGERIPRESFIAINLYAIHRDPEIWKNPEEFQPERFLNDKNELVNLDKIIPFGWGKRLCVGESVARISLFLFFVTLMQSFSFEISKEHPEPSMKNQIGLSRSPFPYYVTVRNRKSVSLQ